MDEKLSQSIALFRYSLIAPLLTETFSQSTAKQRLKEGYTPLQLLKAVTGYNRHIKKDAVATTYIKHCSTFLGRDKPFVDYLEGGEHIENHGDPTKTAAEKDVYEGIGITL